jgi:hypothetical protein
MIRPCVLVVAVDCAGLLVRLYQVRKYEGLQASLSLVGDILAPSIRHVSSHGSCKPCHLLCGVYVQPCTLAMLRLVQVRRPSNDKARFVVNVRADRLSGVLVRCVLAWRRNRVTNRREPKVLTDPWPRPRDGRRILNF